MPGSANIVHQHSPTTVWFTSLSGKPIARVFALLPITLASICCVHKVTESSVNGTGNDTRSPMAETKREV